MFMRNEPKEGCSRILETNIMEQFNNFGWKFSYRIEA